MAMSQRKVIKHQMEKMRVMLEGENIIVKATGQYSSHEDDEVDIDSYEKVPWRPSNHPNCFGQRTVS